MAHQYRRLSEAVRGRKNLCSAVGDPGRDVLRFTCPTADRFYRPTSRHAEPPRDYVPESQWQGINAGILNYSISGQRNARDITARLSTTSLSACSLA